MYKFMPDILNEINAEPELIHKYMKDVAFSMVMQYAFDPEKKMKLPEGCPDYREDKSPFGLSPTNIRYEAKRFYVFCRGDLSQMKREVLFIQLLESLHPMEAEILLAIKDQALHKLYPNINRRLMTQFGFCPLYEEEQKPERALPKSEETVSEVVESVLSVKEEEQVVNKSASKGRGRPKKS